MCRRFAIESVLQFDALELKLSMSGMAVTATAAVALVDDSTPPPDPEPDPGDLPTDDPPIVYPPLPPSGPVGPG
jgi:hypothetical protein